MKLRHYLKSNGAPMAQFSLRHHWKFPRAGDGAKPRAIAPCSHGAPMAHLTRLCASSALPSATLAGASLSPQKPFLIAESTGLP
jgi:hypothetical protein